MNSTSDAITDPATERQLATSFATNLIVCRHHILSYPESHPAVGASLSKATGSLAPLVADGRTLTLGISRQGILLKNETLAPEITKLRDFSALLASFGILTISFTSELATEDLLLLNDIISRPRGEVWESGGIRQAFAAAGVRTIKIQSIDPSVFVLKDDLGEKLPGEARDPWDVFVHRLLDGYFSVSEDIMLRMMMELPEELGRDFDTVLGGIPEEAHHHAISALADFFVSLDKQQGDEGLSDDTLGKIASFITGISPRLRRAFILNICNSPRAASVFNERLLQRIRGAAFLEAMQAVATHGENVPEMVLRIMGKLAASAETAPALDAAMSGPDGVEKVRGLLRESAIEQFIPPAYQKTLTAILATDALPEAEARRLDELRETLENDRIEEKISAIIIEIIRTIPAAERGEGIRRNLMALIPRYLAAKDFSSLEQVCRAIAADAPSADTRDFFGPGFVQEILDAAALLGRENHQDIRSLIKLIGRPFVVPLLERLFAETNRLLRRLWFDCLADLGEMVRDAVMERLNDGRWYAIRNLVVLLRNFSDQDVQRQVRRLVNHPHPKVRIEVLKNLLYYHDPTVDAILLRDFESDDPVRKMLAVQVSEMSANPEIIRRLLAIVESGGVRDYGLEIKSAAVQALAGIGDVQALPGLKALLFSGSLLHPGKHAKLKALIIRVLPRFPATQARPLLEEIIASGNKSIAPLAAEILKGLQGAGS